MMDGSGLGPRTRMTRDYGEVIEADSFVRRRWEPADENARILCYTSLGRWAWLLRALVHPG
jgi:hypothetical protein